MALILKDSAGGSALRGALVEHLEPRQLLSAPLESGFEPEKGNLAPGAATSYPLHLTDPGWVAGFAYQLSDDEKHRTYGPGLWQLSVYRGSQRIACNLASWKLSTWYAGAREPGMSHGKALDPGDYTVRIQNLDTKPKDAARKFALYLAIDYAGDSVATAFDGKALPTSHTFVSYARGADFGENNKDYYHFTTTTPRQITLSISGLSTTTSHELAIFTIPSGSTKQTTAGSIKQNGNVSLTATVDAGDVYVFCGAAESAATNFSLNVTSTAAPALLKFNSIALNVGAGRTSRPDLETNGDLEIKYSVLRTLPENLAPVVALYWATGNDESSIIGNRPAIRTESLGFAAQAGDHTVIVKIADLRHQPSNATRLVAVLDATRQLIVPNRADLVRGTTVGLGKGLSYELDKRTPIGPSRYARAALYLRGIKSIIDSQAARFDVPAEAIAGAIAWEAIQNAKSSGFYGPGKVHSFVINPLDITDSGRVELTHRYGVVLPLLQVGDRAQYTTTDKGAVEYIAAIMNAYAVESELAGIKGMRANPAILVTFYNGVQNQNLDTVAAYFKQRVAQGVKSASDMTPNGWMGQWVQHNLDYLQFALAGTYTP